MHIPFLEVSPSFCITILLQYHSIHYDSSSEVSDSSLIPVTPTVLQI